MTKPLKPKTTRFLPRLTIQAGLRAGEEIIIRKDTTLIGRGEMCDIILNEPLISRRHCHITWDGAYCTLEDLRSTNGTLVNNQRLTAPRVLKDGDCVRLGEVTLTFGDPQATLTGLKWPTLVFDPAGNRVFVNRKPIDLSAKEFAALAYLHEHAERFCGKDEIAKAVWPDYTGEVFDYQIESLIRRLRHKIERNPDDPRLITTMRGRGYRLITSNDP
jgi:hypothetical protein